MHELQPLLWFALHRQIDIFAWQTLSQCKLHTQHDTILRNPTLKGVNRVLTNLQDQHARINNYRKRPSMTNRVAGFLQNATRVLSTMKHSRVPKRLTWIQATSLVCGFTQRGASYSRKNYYCNPWEQRYRSLAQTSRCPEILQSYTANLTVEGCTELKVDHFFEDDHKSAGIVTAPYKEGGAYKHPEGLIIERSHLWKSFVLPSDVFQLGTPT